MNYFFRNFIFMYSSLNMIKTCDGHMQMKGLKTISKTRNFLILTNHYWFSQLQVLSFILKF